MLEDNTATRVDMLIAAGEPCSPTFYVVDPLGDCPFSLLSAKKKNPDQNQAEVFESLEEALTSDKLKENGRVFICQAFHFQPDDVWYDIEDFDRETNDDDEPILNMPALCDKIGEGLDVYLIQNEEVDWACWEDGRLYEREIKPFKPHPLLKKVSAVDPAKRRWR